jgi:hypothetical protein
MQCNKRNSAATMRKSTIPSAPEVLQKILGVMLVLEITVSKAPVSIDTRGGSFTRVPIIYQYFKKSELFVVVAL